MKILIAEDEPISRRVLEANLLEWGYDVIVVTDGQEALEILQGPNSPSLVISDWMMPRMDGLTLCREIRRMDIIGYVYVILLTAEGAKADVIEGFESGADDFLIKPFNREELKYRTRIGERIINLEHRILELANTDSLTGVLNRRAFMERMTWEVARSHRDKTPLSLILTDIDHFKDVNDTRGHQAGDTVFQWFAEILSTSVRPYDFIGRNGGEAFVVCLPGASLSQAETIAERMRAITEITGIMPQERTQPIFITASFGVASFTGNPLDTMILFIKRADDALYRAKHEGRNRVCAGHVR